MKKYMYNPIKVIVKDVNGSYTGYMLDSWLEMFDMIKNLETNDIVERVQLTKLKLNDKAYISYFKENEDGTEDDVFYVRSIDCDSIKNDNDFYNYVIGAINKTREILVILGIK